MELEGVVTQPPPPDGVVRLAGGDEGPEGGPVTEDAQVGKLVDDDGLEGRRRGEDEAPREGEAALPGGTPPARPRVADRDRPRGHGEGSPVVLDGPFDGATSLGAAPVAEDGGRWSEFAHRQPKPDHPALARVAGRTRIVLDRCSAPVARLDPEAVEGTAEAEQAAVADDASLADGRQRCPTPSEVTLQPGLAAPQERLDERLRGRPAAAVRGRQADDETEPRIDGRPETAGALRPAEEVRNRTAAQVREPVRRFGGHDRHGAIAGVLRWRSRRARAPGSAVRYSRDERPMARGPTRLPRGRTAKETTVINPLLSLELFHLHGDRQVRMVQRPHHDPADHDLERALAEGAELYGCPSCKELVLVAMKETVPGRRAPLLEP